MQPLTCDMWLIEPNAMRQFKALAASEIRVNLEDIRASRSESSKQKTIGILPVHGVIEARQSLIGEMLGMSSYEGIGRGFDILMADESVKGIVLDVMSPGGMAYGAPELADKIFQARGTKPIIAVANPLAASGAYWIAAAADRIVMPPSADVGSVGAIHEHLSIARKIEDAGGDVTVTRSTDAPFKAEQNDWEPLSEEARQNIQMRLDEIHSNFVADLAKFRGVSVDYVNENFGRGRVVGAKQAVKSGMADKIMTRDELLGKMLAGRVRIAGSRSEDDWDRPTLRESTVNRLAEVRAMIEEPEETEVEQT